MVPYKFKAGQTVKLNPSLYLRNARGDFEIVRAMPEEHGVRQYRVKSVSDGVVRVVTESEIE